MSTSFKLNRKDGATCAHCGLKKADHESDLRLSCREQHDETPRPMSGLAIVHAWVCAVREIAQCPTSDVPNVPRGTRGYVEDYDGSAELYYVDFGEPYGVVACSLEELR